MKVYKFEADWCGPCKMAKPIWDKFKSLHPELTFEEVNVDNNPGLAQEYNVMSIPMFMAINRGDNLSDKGYTGVPKLQNLEELLV